MSVKLSPGVPPTLEEDPYPFADLVEQIAARADRAAFARLFAWFAPRVKAHLIRLGVDPALAEDQALDTMIAVWRHAARFDRNEASVATWVFRIARNRGLDAPRQERRTAAKLPSPLAGEGPITAPPAWRTPPLPHRLPA